MFGYVRPLKAELLMKEFTRFRAAYCGLCKQISEQYGQIPRMSVSYDLTFLSLLLISLSSDDAQVELESCILNPLKKKPILKDHKALEFCADMSILLTWLKAKDDTGDEKKIKGVIMSAALRRSGLKAKRLYPKLSEKMALLLKELNLAEKGKPSLIPADIFGSILAEIFSSAVAAVLSELTPEFAAALTDSGKNLGRWTYLIDAIDDYEHDTHNNEWNPFSGLSLEQARKEANQFLIEEEIKLDRTFALLPYERDGSIIYNVVVLGLPSVRDIVIQGEKLEKL